MKIKKTIRIIAGWLLGWLLILSGSIRKAKKTSFKTGVITPVCFHHPDKKLFEKIIIWFKENGYFFISSEQLINILKKEYPCPKGALWLSFDDGWKNNLDHVIPVVKKHSIPITIFISTQPIIEGTFWWTKVAKHLSSSSKYIEEIKNMGEDERMRLIRSIDENVKYSPDERVSMTIKDVQEISKIPQVTIGGHTVNHPILPNCTDNQVEYEIKESQRKLQEWTGKKVKLFAYPNGDFDLREKEVLKKFDYELAATIVPEFAHPDTDPFLVPRCVVMNYGSFAENLCHALGVWQPFINKVKKILRQ